MRTWQWLAVLALSWPALALASFTRPNPHELLQTALCQPAVVRLSPAFNGNLTDAAGMALRYDAENRLTNTVSGSMTVTATYDGQGNRIKLVTVTAGQTNVAWFVLDYADPLRRPLAELDSAGNPVRYFVWGRGLVAQVETNGTIRYFHADGQGSTLALTDNAGAPTDAWFYSPYGQVLNCTGSTAVSFTWIGGYGVRADAPGLYFMRHRYYHPGLMRFTSADPIGLAGGGNLFAYANGSPLVLIDPWGLCSDQLWFDRLGSWAASSSASIQSTMIETYPWPVAGALNTVVVIGQGIVSTPQTIGHLGEGAGTFAGNPSWETAPGMFMDISVAASVMAAGLSPLPSANASLGNSASVGYHATDPANVNSIMQNGLRSSSGGRMGGGGPYVNSTPQGAIAEYYASRPNAPPPTVLTVEYNPGVQYTINPPPAYHTQGPLPLAADTLTAESVQAPGTFNTIIRNGSAVVRP